MNEQTLSNAMVQVWYHPETKQVTVYDLVDRANEPAMLNLTKRSLAKAMRVLTATFTDTTTFKDVGTILRDNGVRMHYWCRMD